MRRPACSPRWRSSPSPISVGGSTVLRLTPRGWSSCLTPSGRDRLAPTQRLPGCRGGLSRRPGDQVLGGERISTAPSAALTAWAPFEGRAQLRWLGPPVTRTARLPSTWRKLPPTASRSARSRWRGNSRCRWFPFSATFTQSVAEPSSRSCGADPPCSADPVPASFRAARTRDKAGPGASLRRTRDCRRGGPSVHVR
jgi:hypothetical protein